MLEFAATFALEGVIVATSELEPGRPLPQPASSPMRASAEVM
jgi:hypothetical protein